tara:strand:+ start:176 stop:589 length:414 start_codon:yes stop_codon:yes gene_type:complete
LIKKRKKKKKTENALVEDEFVEKPYSELKQILYAILMYLSGIPYIYIWMQTKFYLHDRDFFEQPYMLQAIGLPAILLTIMFLTDFKFNNIFRLGDKKIGEIIFVAIASYITVACVLGSYILGIIILGFFGMIITSFF